MLIRPFQINDITPLTALLHAAYAELGARGLNFTAWIKMKTPPWRAPVPDNAG